MQFVAVANCCDFPDNLCRLSALWKWSRCRREYFQTVSPVAQNPWRTPVYTTYVGHSYVIWCNLPLDISTWKSVNKFKRDIDTFLFAVRSDSTALRRTCTVISGTWYFLLCANTVHLSVFLPFSTSNCSDNFISKGKRRRKFSCNVYFHLSIHFSLKPGNFERANISPNCSITFDRATFLYDFSPPPSMIC